MQVVFSWDSGVPVGFERLLRCSGTLELHFYLLSSLLCLLFALTLAACNTKVNSEDLHYGVLPRFPSVLWSARELVPLLTFIISLRTVPTETFLSEAVPIYFFETCLPLQYAV